MRFIDLFCGCGGLSLGLVQAGLTGVAGVERTATAHGTFDLNFGPVFDWPDWFPRVPMETAVFVREHGQAAGRCGVDVLAGGPPCQGFSRAGRMDPDDPRNKLFLDYLDAVAVVRPRFIVAENVPGFAAPLADGTPAASERMRAALESMDYRTFGRVVRCGDFGVPQVRRRYILFGVRNDVPCRTNPHDILASVAGPSRAAAGLPVSGDIPAGDALADLETVGRRLVPCPETGGRGFVQAAWEAPGSLSAYARSMRAGMDEGTGPDSVRLANHTDRVRDRFREIIATCSPGVLTDRDRKRLGIRKNTVVLLGRERVPSGITTLPDDMVHYSEPRIPTVREMARLQSFPDVFRFTGPFTAGGKSRKETCPRCGQVGNAVPPLLGRAIGYTLRMVAGHKMEDVF